MLVQRGTHWNITTDVVVIGYGLAGAVSAITAKRKGVRVLLIEKQDERSHSSNSSLSGGAFANPTDVARCMEYLEALYQVSGEVDQDTHDIVRKWTEYSSENVAWFRSMGVEPRLVARMGEHNHLPGVDSMEVYQFPGGGLKMMNFLYDVVRQEGIEVMYGTAAKNIIVDYAYEVIGVVAVRQSERQEPSHMHIRAERAIVLACGGFEFDERMKLDYLKNYPTYFSGSPTNTGDGIRMAQEIGADLWHMNCCSAGAVAKFDDFNISFLPDLGGKGWLARLFRGSDSREPAGYIVVDKEGKRFINENLLGTKIHCAYYEFALFDSRCLEFRRIPSYWIFDQKRMEAGPLPSLLSGPSGPRRLYSWSRDNRLEFERGWIISAQSVQELAIRLETRPGHLEDTVARYNRHCRDGSDPDFGRDRRDLVPLSTPLYAVRLWPGGPNTQGGPKRNSRAQVISTSGQPIRRLYSAGELGSVFGMLYPSAGCNLAECIAFGRIAGSNSAQESRYTWPESCV